MPKYKVQNTGCGQSSPECQGSASPECQDVCVNPACGDPKLLAVLAPVIYDEIGINLCRSVPLGVTVSTAYPSAVAASAEGMDISYNTSGTAATTVAPISGRPNCYEVTLTDLTVTFAVKLYDCANRLLATLTVPAVYLPTNSTLPDYAYYDEDTNPDSVTLEIFAPYGISYQDASTESPSLNIIGFSSVNNMLRQGLNLSANPCVLCFNTDDSTVTIGLSLILQSIYFAQYKIPHQGKAVIPKGSLVPPEDSVCMNFVSGGILDREIKPLELGPPDCEEYLKQDCSPACEPCCGSYTLPAVPAGEPEAGEDA